MAEALDRSARPPETTELLQVRFDSPADGWLGFELRATSRSSKRSPISEIIATHSPIILTFPGASILSFDGERVESTRLEDTAHFQITKGILESPQRYWKHLLHDDE